MIVCCLLLWSVPLGPTGAIGFDPLRDQVARTVEDRLASAGPGGMVVGVIRDGHRVVVGRGDPGRPDGGPPDGRTLFQIASLTKPFTGTIMAELMREGRVDPADPLERHLRRIGPVPLGHLPQFDGRPVRLRDLATHTAGLPNVPETPRFSWSRLEDPRNPYKALSRGELALWLAAYQPPVPPGTRFSYSNTGMAVLGEALSAAAGQSYEALLKRVVTVRFDLRDTTLHPTAEQQARKASGHARGVGVPDWEAPAMLPAFGLYSTADDLLGWMAANLGDCAGAAAGPDGRGCEPGVAATLDLAQAVQVEGRSLADPGALGGGAMALGWFVARADDGTPIHWHSGSTGGFNAYIAFSRAHRWGVVALTNSDPDKVTADRVVVDLVRRLEARPEVASLSQ
ncbi:serine hydrolase domain-containing protein [Azospirillum picis]|uniref:D-alanyl-D-alanine-carboxypeptidase/D-alanyl-D-alanine-endopeptidase n=1 Tax=Azospirillum picis TaxID=488438 RepID=A0ABU0MKQ2_9PROT|nr:serine hydrolase [Azospirillum picis]MBP2300105.1 D-alanyl-D-alanine-carboxypeptidase/D-alanyl-D-alanine-endopeptidase [Azospirillum picis]MDQ0534053.1 D-alanyl-D-alanine-carboxypeptidase/D-alanyl-D-alanine-endopeptidase [Azospirillum picis]